MRKPNSLSVTFIAAAMYSVSAILMSAFADPGSSGGGGSPFSLDQIAAGDKKAIGRFFAANRIGLDLDNFMEIAFHGQADFGDSSSPPSPLDSFAWLASCLNTHSGHLFVVDEDGRIVLSEKTGCQRSVEVKDENGDGVLELISTSSSGGTGVGSTSVNYYFHRDSNFRRGLTFQKAGYETGAITLFPGASDWRRDVIASRKSEGSIEFHDTNRDGFRERAVVTYTDRFLILGYLEDKDSEGVVHAKAAKAVRDLFGERLGVEKTWVENLNWTPVSFEYLKQ
jgi:hypothetical protein